MSDAIPSHYAERAQIIHQDFVTVLPGLLLRSRRLLLQSFLGGLPRVT